MISADELFHNGQIRPLTLPPLPDLDPDGSDDDDGGPLRRARGRDVTPRCGSVHRRARSISPLRSASPRLKLLSVTAPDLARPAPAKEEEATFRRLPRRPARHPLRPLPPPPRQRRPAPAGPGAGYSSRTCSSTAARASRPPAPTTPPPPSPSARGPSPPRGRPRDRVAAKLARAERRRRRRPMLPQAASRTAGQGGKLEGRGGRAGAVRRWRRRTSGCTRRRTGRRRRRCGGARSCRTGRASSAASASAHADTARCTASPKPSTPSSRGENRKSGESQEI
ncbi:hypothetical protein PR202_gb19604 [Eleusine coracana subsp. coracana]|uniref:Uncharacterized protein n=1 Tax=Eleusine coracana subsp. coracana TaxID=191504 RepID=A0AAV5F8P3_ELECO|nr:hypothetical protein PR202_gb19604 [Eleusine coracana subsp. coracana]